MNSLYLGLKRALRFLGAVFLGAGFILIFLPMILIPSGASFGNIFEMLLYYVHAILIISTGIAMMTIQNVINHNIAPAPKISHQSYSKEPKSLFDDSM
jgi:hypothetical protein